MKKAITCSIVLGLGVFLFPATRGVCESLQQKAPITMDLLYPGITPGLLTYAGLADLPEGVLLRSGTVEITSKELADTIVKTPKELRVQLEKNKLLVLEQVAMPKILLILAKNSISKPLKDKAGTKDADIIRSYLQSIVSGVSVSDKEIRDFYKENQDMCGGASFEEAKGSMKDFMVQQKKQDTVTAFIKNIGKTVPLQVDASWTKEQAVSAQDNPVDKVRSSGKPSMVDFGADGCRPCDMMAPILETLKSKYEGRLNVLFIHVRQEEILAERYGVQSIPVQVFFDKEGKEFFRHTGFFPQNEIEKKISAMGVK